MTETREQVAALAARCIEHWGEDTLAVVTSILQQVRERDHYPEPDDHPTPVRYAAQGNGPVYWDTHHALPDTQGCGGGPGMVPKWPWRTMPVGASFLVPFPHEHSPTPSAQVYKTGRRFTVRKGPDGWRVWRIK